MTAKSQIRGSRSHLLLCLLLVVALIGASVAAAAHMHLGHDNDQGQCALCMTWAQMVVAGTIAALLLLLTIRKDRVFFSPVDVWASGWLPPAQRVRPPPSI